jgi:hypothetical protein
MSSGLDPAFERRVKRVIWVLPDQYAQDLEQLLALARAAQQVTEHLEWIESRSEVSPTAHHSNLLYRLRGCGTKAREALVILSPNR